MIFRAFIIWLLIAVAEVLHGNLRVRFLNRGVGRGSFSFHGLTYSVAQLD